MLRIAVCDDDIFMINKLQDFITTVFNEKNIDVKINTYNDSQIFINNYKNNICDFVFLDINMEPINGFEIAKYINENNYKTKIIFITNFENIVYDSFEYLPIGFIRKSYFETDFIKYVDIIINRYNYLCEYINDKNDGKIYISDICYITNEKNYVNIKMNNEKNIKIRKTFKSIYDELKSNLIVQINKGIMINIVYIKSINKNVIVLDNGEEQIISRNYISDFKEKYFNYMRG